MRKQTFFILSLLFTLSLFGEKRVDDFVNLPILKNANISLFVQELESEKVICQYNAERIVVPASTMKIITTATALEVLGPNFRFETLLQTDGELDNKGTLHGNVYIRGCGDPTLGSEFIGDKEFLNLWVDAIRKEGIKNIKGQIIADASLFDDEGVSPHWLWQDVGNYYAAGAYGISYKDNTASVYFNSGEPGTQPSIVKILPHIPDLTIENNLKSSNITFDSAYFYGLPQSNHRVVYGKIPARKKNFVVKTDISNPGLLLAKDFHQRLLDRGFTIEKAPSAKVHKQGNRKIIYSHFSPPLRRIVKEINFKSNNHYSEHLFRYLALQISPQANSADGAHFIRSFWEKRGLAVNQLFMYDGSGLSPENGASSAFFVSLLRYMKQESKNVTVFYNSLARAGQEGTISGLLKNTPLQGKLRAKSGSMTNVRAYTGYIERDGKTLLFAVMVNNYNGNTKAMVKELEKFFLKLK